MNKVMNFVILITFKLRPDTKTTVDSLIILISAWGYTPRWTQGNNMGSQELLWEAVFGAKWQLSRPKNYGLWLGLRVILSWVKREGSLSRLYKQNHDSEESEILIIDLFFNFQHRHHLLSHLHPGPSWVHRTSHLKIKIKLYTSNTVDHNMICWSQT
jgi:hypothetical protein